MRLVYEILSASYALWVSAQQNADEILLLLDPAFKVGDGSARGKYQLLSLPHVKHGSGAVIGEHLGQTQRVLSGSERLLRDLELQIQFAQLKIGAGNIAYQRIDDLALGPFLPEQTGAR